jgi:hypothetical protein
MKSKTNRSKWKLIEDTDAAVSFWLTGESLIKGITVPSPPSSKTPTVVRITHSNSYGPVDADIYVRLGDPDHPLDAEDFDNVSDWQPAQLVEDLTWGTESESWAPRANSNGEECSWSGTHDAEIEFPKGKSQIEIKVISRDEAVCSIVLANWQVNIR